MRKGGVSAVSRAKARIYKTYKENIDGYCEGQIMLDGGFEETVKYRKSFCNGYEKTHKRKGF